MYLGLPDIVLKIKIEEKADSFVCNKNPSLYLACVLMEIMEAKKCGVTQLTCATKGFFTAPPCLVLRRHNTAMSLPR